MDSPWEVYPIGGSNCGEIAGFQVPPFNLNDWDSLDALLRETQPSHILHLAAISRADEVHANLSAAWDINVHLTHYLARWCDEHDARMIFTSTDLVFDGRRGAYREADRTAPLLDYGRTKQAAERRTTRRRHTVARLSLLYGPGKGSRPTFLDHAMAELRAGKARMFFEDEFRTPLDYATAAHILVRLLELHDVTVLNVGGNERVSRYELMRRAASVLGVDERMIGANRLSDVQFEEPRPADVSLNTEKLGRVLPEVRRPPIEQAIAAMAIV